MVSLSPKVNLLVDIQAKLQAGKGAGYARWAKTFNLKQMAQTLNYLTEDCGELFQPGFIEKTLCRLMQQYLRLMLCLEF